VPLIFVVAPGAGQVKKDTAETGSSECCLHNVLKVLLVRFFFFSRGRLSLASVLYSRSRWQTLRQVHRNASWRRSPEAWGYPVLQTKSLEQTDLITTARAADLSRRKLEENLKKLREKLLQFERTEIK